MGRDTVLKLNGTPEVVTIAIGVAGWIPDFTYKGLKEIFKSEAGSLAPTRALRIVAQSFAIKAWRAFRNNE